MNRVLENDKRISTKGPVRKMEYNLEPTRSSKPKQISNARKRNDPLVPEHQNSKFEKRCEVVYPFAQPFVNQGLRSTKVMDDDHAVQLKPSRNFRKKQLRYKIEEQDELIRHMSNLPAYLQQAERQKNVQEKALNFGVLDWKRLEKWKYNERMPARLQRKASSSGNSLPMATMARSLSKASSGRKQSTELHFRSFREERLHGRVQQYRGKFKSNQDSQTTLFRTSAGQQMDISQKVKSFSRSYPETDSVKSMKTKVDQNATATMQKEILSSSQIKQTSPSLVPITDQSGKKRTTKGDEANHCPKHFADEPRSIVLLVPKIPPRRSSAQNSQSSEPRTSCHVDSAEDNRGRSLDCISNQELHSAKPYDEISQPCSLPASVSVAPGMQSDACACSHQNDAPITPRTSEVRCCHEEENSSDNWSGSVETSKGMDLETVEQPAVKGRHSSPIRRFSFSLGRLSRSFSFKESSTAPQLNSTYEAAKSGPVSSELLAGIDDSYVEKARTGERRRSSPFRRLLDPILKPKGAHSARMVQPSGKSSISVSSEPISTNRPLQDQQAILQLTIKNGLPYFRFVVDDSSDILAAAVTKPPTPGKADCSLTYTFYSLREIKKSGGWISHGSKEKNCSFGCNIVGEMKFVYWLSEMRRESVLYTVDVRKRDKGQPEVSPNKEIVATIVMDSAAELNVQETKEVNGCNKKEGSVQHSLGSIHDGVEKQNFISTIAILPAGVHSSPIGCTPSSLIDRWKSGGLCDCGGWDMGCKLRVLTENNRENICSRSTRPYSALERIDLFSQNREGRSQPNFSLMPLKDGLYSVKFKASLSSLEAFSISVSVITSKKLPNILDMDFVPEAKLSAEPMKLAKKIKNPDTVPVQLPAKYVPSPPPSPVGRI